MSETPNAPSTADVDPGAVADRYRRLAAAMTARIDAVPPDRWDSPSPCAEWDARGVVRHLVEVQGMFLGFAGATLPPGLDVADDPGGAWRAATGALQPLLDDPERATAEFDGFFGRTTLAASVDRFACFDLLVHSWDLARATGGDERIDPAELAWLEATAQGFGPALRSPQVCGPELVPPDGADDRTRLLAFLGRRAW